MLDRAGALGGEGDPDEVAVAGSDRERSAVFALDALEREFEIARRVDGLDAIADGKAVLDVDARHPRCA